MTDALERCRRNIDESDRCVALLAKVDCHFCADDWPAAVTIRDLRAVVEEVDTLRLLVSAESSCAQCGADLLPPNGPRHCLDCSVDEEQEQQWRDERDLAQQRLDKLHAHREVKDQP